MTHTHRNTVLSCFLSAAVAVLPGCDGAEKSKDAANTPSEGGAAKTDGAKGPEKIAGKPIDAGGNPAAKAQGANEASYEVVIEPPASVPPGSDAIVTVKVVPKGEWHMNLEYPTSLALKAPDGGKLAKEKVTKADDAVKVEESKCEIGVGFTPESPGEKTFTGKLKFAVCQDDACAPKTEEIEFVVAVK